MEEILNSTSKKHVKIFLLNQLGLKNKDIAAACGTNVGHVFNVIKDYRLHPEKAEKAIAI